MKKLGKKVMCGAVSAAMVVTSFAGCGGSSDNSTTTTAAATNADGATEAAGEGASKYPEALTIDVFDGQANFQGTQSGWFAKVVKDKFNLELNIIAPNVAGGGDTLYQTRSASGNLGDLILTQINQSRLKDMVAAGLIYDMKDIIGNEKNLQKYADAIKDASSLAEAEGTWCVPSEVSENNPTEPGEVSDPTNAPSVRWDVYKEAGYPEMKTLEDLIEVGKQMQEKQPKSDSGKQTYMFSWFKDWDGDVMQNAQAFSCLYGIRPMSGFAFGKADGSLIESCIDTDSSYVRGLKFMYEANKAGLVDPESTTQNFDILQAKYTDGQVLYSLWPWLGAGYYNTSDNIAKGKGFQTAVIDDMKCLGYGASTLGKATNAIMIGSQTKDPQRLADFIDWLYSPEGIEMSSTQTGGKCGPEGLTWELKDGKPVLTDFGVKAFVDIDETLQVPSEWGTGTWKDGISALNYNAVSTKEMDTENNFCYNYQTWDDYRDRIASPLSEDWEKHFDTKDTAIDFLTGKELTITEPGTNYAIPEYSTDVNTIKEQCKQVIIEKSWQMAFAKDEEEFNSLLKEMQDTCNGLGYEQVYEVDKKNVEDQFKAFQDTIAAADQNK